MAGAPRLHFMTLFIRKSVLPSAVTPTWETLMTHDVASLTRCRVLGNSASVVPVLNAWMESLSQVMTDRTIAHGFGFVSETVRTTAFFSRLCSCGYDYDRGRSVVPGIPFPPIILDILRYIMPICGVHDDTLWPTACNVNFYKDGFECF